MENEREEVGQWGFEFQFEGVVVEGRDADVIEICNLSLMIWFSVFEGVEHVGVLSSKVGREDALVAVDKVVRREGVAVSPACIFTEEEGVGALVLRNFPSLGDAGSGLKCLWVWGQESFKKPLEYFVFYNTVDEMWVEFVGLGAIGDEEDLLLIAKFDWSNAFAATDIDG